MTGFLVFALLLAHGLRVHFHAFAGHESLYGHGHEVELHVGGIPTESGHDDPASETDLARFAILKLKFEQADSLVLLLAVIVLVFALNGAAPWRPAKLAQPHPGGDVRTPPLRAPPR